MPARLKIRVVVQGFHEPETGADKTAPVASMESVHLLVALAAQHAFVLKQADIKTAFLHARIPEHADSTPVTEIMPMLCLSYSLAASILSLHQVPSAALTPAYSIFCPCCILLFLLMQLQATLIKSTAGTPTTSVQPAPELATLLAYVGCPQVRLARFYAAKPIIRHFYSGVFP